MSASISSNHVSVNALGFLFHFSPNSLQTGTITLSRQQGEGETATKTLVLAVADDPT